MLVTMRYKLFLQLSTKHKKMTDLENKLQEAEDKLRKTEKNKKDQIRQLENKVGYINKNLS